jgi:hypothetical protein
MFCDVFVILRHDHSHRYSCVVSHVLALHIAARAVPSHLSM